MGDVRAKNLQDLSTIPAEMVQQFVAGKFDSEPVLHRVAVLKIDHEGGVLSGPAAEMHKKETPNPRGSILGQIVTDAGDISSPEDAYLVFWPFFPYDLMPVKEGEHVYVIFEDVEGRHGLWLTRIPEPNKINNLNLTPGAKRFQEDAENELEEGTAATEKIVRDLDENPKVVAPGEDFQVEEDDVQEFNSRTGDRIIHGSNNTTIIMSRDRVDTVSSGAKEKAGTIDVVAGRANADISLGDDAARVMVTMKSDVDANFEVDAGEAAGEASAVVAKADEVRVIARNGMKLVVESGSTSITIDKDGNVKIDSPEAVEVSAKEMKVSTKDDIVLDAGKNVLVGGPGATSKLVKGDGLKTFLQSITDILAAAPVDVVGIPGLGLVNSSVGSALSQLYSSYDNLVLSSDNKVE